MICSSLLCAGSLGFLHVLPDTHQLPASSIWSYVTLPLFHNALAALAFFLCPTLTKLFCLKVFAVLFPWHGKCLPKLLTWLVPSQYSDTSQNIFRDAFPEFSIYKFSCPTTNAFITGVLKLCCTSTSLENLLKHRLLSQSF